MIKTKDCIGLVLVRAHKCNLDHTTAMSIASYFATVTLRTYSIVHQLHTKVLYMQLMKAYVAETSCNQLLIDTAT